MLVKTVCFIFGHDVIFIFNQMGLITGQKCLRCKNTYPVTEGFK